MEKYIKYNYKIQNAGSIYFKGIAKKRTNDEYNKLDKEDQDEFPFYCPIENPYLCSINTPNYGLCKKKPKDCKQYNGENEYLIYDLTDNKRKDEYEYGKNYNYKLYDEKNKNCSKIEENSWQKYEGDKININNKFKIMTYNCWWSLRLVGDKEKDDFNYNFFKIRINEIGNIILKSNADIICLQEVGQETFNILKKKLKRKYKYFYEEPFTTNLDNNGDRKRSIETLCFTKYPVRSFKLFSVEGNLNYNNSMLMIEYDNLVIFNVYLQAGSKNSPGQKDLWFNYSRCRYNEYLSIQKYLKDNKIKKPIVVLGDFNTDLNGNSPELKAFSKLKLQDSWLDMHNDGGFTENTKVNYMRWNLKFEEKILRIDGIFHTKKKIITNNINIVGDKPIDISKKLQDGFYKFRIPNKDDKDKLIRKNNDNIQFWPSDHFGVIAELEII